MDKVARQTFLTILCASALLFLACAQAATPKAGSKARVAKSAGQSTAAQPLAATPAISPQAEPARKYSPIQYCHGQSYPAASWMQVRDFLDKYSPLPQGSPAGSQARGAATDPKLSTIPKLEYPESMRPSKLDGAVAVMVAVTKDGTASDALVVCSNHAAFSEAALAAVKAATFAPATRDGKPIESVATLPIDFHP